MPNPNPVPSPTTFALGIFQPDVIIRTAIIASLEELRRNPYLLDYVFRGLATDDLTNKEYGKKQSDLAKEWFLSTNIPVAMAGRLDAPTFPIITISLLDSSEAEATLADVHYETQEDTESSWPILSGPMRPVSYAAASGLMVLPDDGLDGLRLCAGMSLLDSDGNIHPIIEVLDDDTIAIAPGTLANFDNVLIKGAKPLLITQLESLSFKESYAIACHVQGEQIHLIYLHSILVFLLLRYKQLYFEARGFERSTISSKDFSKNDLFEDANVWTRSIILSGYVRHYWPKAVNTRIYDVVESFQVGEQGTSGPGVLDNGTLATEDDWISVDRD